MKGLFQSRKFRQGSMATAITVVVTALVLVINLIATSLTDKYSLTLDLTPDKLFSITDETREYLDGLGKDITIYVMDTEESFTSSGSAYVQVVEVLRQYALASSHITLEFVDLVSNPAIAQKYSDLQLTTYSILVTSGERVRHLNPAELFEFETNVYGESIPVASTAEQVLTSAVLGVTSDTVFNVAVITGHNEESFDAFSEMLTANNYLLGYVNITTEDIDPVYDLAIVAAPERDYTEEELRRLDAFLSNGGDYGKTVLYFANFLQTDLPNLDAFLEDWGIRLGEGLVGETDAARIYTSLQGMPDPYIASLDYAETYYSEAMANAGKVAVGYYGRPMEVLFENKDAIYTTTLLQYAASAVLVDMEGNYEPAADLIPHFTMSQWLGAADYSTLLVCSTSAFVDSVLIGNPNFANSDYILGLLADLVGKEDTIFIQSKSLAGATLDMPAFQAIVLGVLLVAVFPLALLVFGLVIWARRRHR